MPSWPGPGLLNRNWWVGQSASTGHPGVLWGLQFEHCSSASQIPAASRLCRHPTPPGINSCMTKNVIQGEHFHHLLESGRRAGMCWPRPGGGLSSWGHLKATSLRPAILAVYHGTISSVLALLGHNTLLHWFSRRTCSRTTCKRRCIVRKVLSFEDKENVLELDIGESCTT